MKNLLVVEDSTIRAILKDPRALELLPCLAGPKNQLASIQPGRENCARCKAEKKRITSDAMRVARQCLRNSKGERLLGVKKIVGAKQLRVITKNPAGKRVQYTL